MVKFSFIIAFRNREYQRVKNCIESIANQTLQNFEVIFVNYGSDEEVSQELEPLVNSYFFCRYFYTETRGLLWNKSNALNIGLMYAKGEYIIVTDVDLMLCKDYLEIISKKISNGIFLTHRSYYLPDNYPLSTLINQKTLLDRENIQINFIGLLVVNRETALEVNGFDEFYQVWGAEDIDFIFRLERAGLQRRIIDVLDIPIWHQWHSMASPKKPTPWYLAELNYLYLSKPASCDLSNKGKVLNLEDRPALESYLNMRYKNCFELKITGINHLAFLEFYQGFSKLKPGEMCYLEYANDGLLFANGKMQPLVNLINKILDKFKKFHYRFFREEKIRLSDTVSFKDVKDFLEYFIGVNRDSIEDYCYYPTETKLILVMKKA